MAQDGVSSMFWKPLFYLHTLYVKLLLTKVKDGDEEQETG